MPSRASSSSRLVCARSRAITSNTFTHWRARTHTGTHTHAHAHTRTRACTHAHTRPCAHDMAVNTCRGIDVLNSKPCSRVLHLHLCVDLIYLSIYLSIHISVYLYTYVYTHTYVYIYAPGCYIFFSVWILYPILWLLGEKGVKLISNQLDHVIMAFLVRCVFCTLVRICMHARVYGMHAHTRARMY